MNLIVCVDQNWGIGYNGDLLIRIPEDMHFFRSSTIRKAVVMGRRTFESLPNKQPLKGRTNFVLSNNLTNVSGVTVSRSLVELFCQLSSFSNEDIYVIGGQHVYEELLPFCEKAFVTKFCSKDPFAADRHFPNIDTIPGWEMVLAGDKKEHDEVDYIFCQYKNHHPIDFRPKIRDISKISFDIQLKNAVEFYLPIDIFGREEFDSFCVELLDLLNAYLFPLEYGLSREDIEDFLVNAKGNEDFFDFLYLKRYITDRDSFFHLLRKYQYPDHNGNVYHAFRAVCTPSSINTLRDLLYNSLSLQKLAEGINAEEGSFDSTAKVWRAKAK